MSDASGAKEGGVRYQHLYSWWEMLRLLNDDSPFDWATVEHDGVGAADDLTFLPKPGSSAAAEFHQVKWHVDQRDHYTLHNLTTGDAAVFPKLYKGWKKLLHTGHPRIELWLVSNWHADPISLGKYLDERRELGFKPAFFTDGAVAAVANELREPAGDVEQFCRALRFRLGLFGRSDLEGTIFDDRMTRHGLQRGENARDVARSLVEEWVIRGGDEKRITCEELRQAIGRRGLWAEPKNKPDIVLRIDAYTPAVPDPEATASLDWHAHFSHAGRRIPEEATWSKLVDEVVAVRTKLEAAGAGRLLEVRGKMPLSALMAVGAIFPETRGYCLQYEQMTSGKVSRWISAGSSDARLEENEAGIEGGGRDVLVVFHITGEIHQDVERFVHACPGTFGHVIHAVPASGPGLGSVRSGADAAELANQGKALIKRVKQKYAAPRVHVIMRAPAGFALFLGNRLNAVGHVVTYEQTEDGLGYQRSVTVRPRD